jgi:hypothetical protein
MAQTTIVINGITYDATTGIVVNSSNTPTHMTTKKQPMTTGHNIDGIVSHKKSSFTPTKQRVVQTTAAVHKQTQKSHTLMRKIVKKPGVGVKISDMTPPGSHSKLQPSRSYHNSQAMPTRLEAAMKTPLHTNVVKFGTPNPIKATVAPISVVKEETPQTGHIYRTPPTLERYKQQSADNFVDSQLSKASIANTDKKSIKKLAVDKKRKLVSIAAAAGSTLLVAGFLLYQSVPTISLAYASNKSGVAARIPKGIPSNFALNKSVAYSPGSVTMQFSSRTDDRDIVISGQKSTDTSTSLEEAVRSSSRPQTQVYETSGLKIFVSGPGNADWIDGETHYTVSGSSGLSTEQIASIAKSL